MPGLPSDDRFLQRALELARDAAAFASPNPAVGCVLTSPAGDVIGEGAHRYDERDHAEIAALKDAARHHFSAEGVTAFVTLEPCTVHGRTGPCADALIAAGIARCVVATLDPNPAVCGNGVARMRAAGIAVDVLPVDHALAQAARRLNDAFAFSIAHRRPFVTLKAALSVDGRLAPPPAQRLLSEPYWLTGTEARQDVQRLRHLSDAILTGVGTVLADNPSLTDRTGLPRHRRLLRLVMDGGLRTPPDSVLARSAEGDVLIFCRADAEQARESALRAAGVAIQRLDDLTPAAVLAKLPSSCTSVLLEAGPQINGAFLRAQLVDKVVLYFAESELGPKGIPFANGGASPFTLQERLSSVSRTSFPHGAGEDVRISGYLHDPWTDQALTTI